METTEDAPNLLNEVFLRNDDGIIQPHRWWGWRCSVCEVGPFGSFDSQGDALSGRRRHEKSDRHIKNTTPKTQPVGAQEAREPELHEATLRGLTTRQFGELISLVGKWFKEDGGVH